MKKIVLLICLLAGAAALFAEDLDIFKNCPPAAKEIIDNAEALAAQEKYESAFHALTTDQLSEGADYVIFQKTEYAINYFAYSIMHQVFAFKDFEEGDTFYSVRTADATYNMTMTDPVAMIDKYAEEHGMTPILYLALAEYYEDVWYRYGDQWLISADELQKKAIENYQAALESDFYNIYTLGNYGQMLLQQHDWQNSIKVFSKLIELDEENPSGLYNLAISYFYQQDYENAVEVFKKSTEHPEEDLDYRYDSWMLLAESYYNLNDADTAIKTLEEAKAFFPDFYRANLTLAVYYLGLRQDYDNAFKEFEAAFNTNLNNSEILYKILDNYLQSGLTDNAIEFCETELSKIGKKEYFAKAYLNVYLVQLYAMKAQSGEEYDAYVEKAKKALKDVEPNFKKAKFTDYEDTCSQLNDLVNSL